ncbi:TPA: helix-turn-helix transcriptional regulator [Pseudomonas aeruginosa]|nr:helix-turn-helix transcriptional regulator [Pseudomonas aeruginosa]ELS4619297.1 helix-turn-helix transcriptional regulator [Pseudomonas aeruginosa]MBO7947494.1 helix-turn-helix transcriptional regulator [Pseudomonas aeruginosa]MBO8037213.1 helix-turn-helix transcriptional regulator [Pseudomonas aeruginosa]MCV0147151.1 LexA family transcriptional regulator [Pseudomonas aeruginosa]
MVGPPKVTQAALARACRVKPPSVNDWLSGKTKTIEGENLLNAAAFLRVSPLWLATGKGPMRERLTANKDGNEQSAPSLSEHANVVPITTPPRKRTKYPVISWVRAGDWAESPDNYQPGDADEWLESEEKAGPHGYWLVVDGDSMVPLFPPGSRILVQPEGFDLISGKYYVAICYESGKKRDTTVKQYVRDAGFEYLKPLNPTYRTLDVSENVRIIGRVVDYKLPPGVL